MRSSTEYVALLALAAKLSPAARQEVLDAAAAAHAETTDPAECWVLSTMIEAATDADSRVEDHAFAVGSSSFVSIAADYDW